MAASTGAEVAEVAEISGGRVRLRAETLYTALGRLRSDNAQQEQYLTDVFAIVRSDGQIVHGSHVDDSTLVAGVNDRVQLAELGAELNRGIVEVSFVGHSVRANRLLVRRVEHRRRGAAAGAPLSVDEKLRVRVHRLSLHEKCALLERTLRSRARPARFRPSSIFIPFAGASVVRRDVGNRAVRPT